VAVLAALAVFAAAIGGLVWWTFLTRDTGPDGGASREGARVAPVAVAPIERGPIVFRRTFSGSLEATSAFVVAPKISGRIQRLSVDLADRVSRGQEVALLDDREYVQAVTQAQADLAVARATLAEANSALAIAEREFSRIEELRGGGVASESEFDAAKTAQLAAQARLEVARAQIQRAESSLESARIRLAYTRVEAEWNEGSDERVVAERFVDEGDTVSANAPLLSIVELSPITGTLFITERDYGLIAVGMTAAIGTDAFPGENFEGRIERISPIFRQESRQARVELRIENLDRRLKPGMFVRVTLDLAREDDATIVPESALARRGEEDGVFVVSADGKQVAWRPVAIGLREGRRVQIIGEGLSGRVVVLGQQLLDDGSPIIIPDTDASEDRA